MLVLRRKKDESVMVHDGIEVKVLAISPRGEWVKIGIDASRDVPVFRREVWLQRQEAAELGGEAETE